MWLTRRDLGLSLLALPLAGAVLRARQVPPAGCPRCGWTAPQGRAVTVRTVSALERAVSEARPGDVIRVADGDYPLTTMLEVSTERVAIVGESGNPDKVVLRGRGMTGDSVGVGIAAAAPDIVIADITLRDFGFHAVQVRGERGAARFALHNARLRDAGQQLLKGSVSADPSQADEGLVSCSEFAYTTSAPSTYTNGVDVLRGDRWVVRDNRFTNIRGPEGERFGAGPSVLFWAGCRDTVVERNVVINSFRGIALGLMPSDGSAIRLGRARDHVGGVIRDNVVVNMHPWADEAIEANDAEGVRIERNTVIVEGQVPWSIGVRFPGASATVIGNMTTRQVLLRDGGRAVMEGNAIVPSGRGTP